MPPAPRPETDRPARPLRVALAHDWAVVARGGEQVLEAIARALASRGHALTALYTMADNGCDIGTCVDAIPRITPAIGRLPGASGPLRRWMFPLYPLAVGQLSSRLAEDHHRAPIDLVVSTSSAAIKSLRAPPGVPHLCYCHSPARYAWAQRADYAQGSLLRRLGLAAYSPWFKNWDRRTANRATLMLANSAHIATRIARCYGREAPVVHPPVRTEYFTPDASVRREPFVFIVSALEPYKRVDAAIEAAVRAGRPLIIAGTGSDEPRLRAHAKQASAAHLVRFVGRIDDDRLRDYLRRAHCLLYPQTEDFGITAVEAQACGTPVVALARGGALDTVDDPATGLLVPTLEAFPSAMNRVTHNPAACRANALRFSEDRFAQRFLMHARTLADV